MSANIYYKQVKPKDKTDLPVMAPSAFLDAMGRAFGNPPWILTKTDIPTLTGMAAVHGAYPNENPFHKLIDIIRRFEEIEVWGEG